MIKYIVHIYLVEKTKKEIECVSKLTTFYDLFLQEEFWDNIVNWTNLHAIKSRDDWFADPKNAGKQYHSRKF